LSWKKSWVSHGLPATDPKGVFFTAEITFCILFFDLAASVKIQINSMISGFLTSWKEPPMRT